MPKQYRPAGGKALLRYAVETMLAHPAITHVRVVISEAHRGYYGEAMGVMRHAGADGAREAPHLASPLRGKGKLGQPIAGGAARQDSVRLGLEALAADAPEYVLIHDAARPMLSHALIDRVIGALKEHKAVMPVVPVADTLREAVAGTWQERAREGLMAVQTPQGFDFQTILNAHRALAGEQRTDDIAVLLAYNAAIPVHAVPGEPQNRKVTTPEDMSHLLATMNAARLPRTGMGYDVHRLIPGNGTIRIGGIDIAHDFALEGHSDADVVLHAITDALLGTIADGDIGAHFSPQDARWKGKDSAAFLEDAAARVERAGGTITHIDVTVLCEAPKIAPHRDVMRERIAAILKIPIAQVSVKATTTEGLGFTGRREGIAAQAVANALFTMAEAA